jgi:tight adherence protein B
MVPAIIVFAFVVFLIVGSYLLFTALPDLMARRKVELRLREVAQPVVDLSDSTIVKRMVEGPLPRVDRALARTGPGFRLSLLIEQSGVRTTPSAMMLIGVVLAVVAGWTTAMFVWQPLVIAAAALIGLLLPFAWLRQRRTARFNKFEEHFPEALDLMSRAIRAGHAFQTALGMVADELPEPIGPEFKKTFDQQNFGLPLRDALNGLAERIAILDVRFFVTAVAIQRESGGNLSEILDNLAHVVRERFKIRRQVRVHTAHGRFTGYVLLALPAALALALSFISPEHIRTLFRERMGQMMVMGAIVMQTVGFIWIRKVIKIEV